MQILHSKDTAVALLSPPVGAELFGDGIASLGGAVERVGDDDDAVSCYYEAFSVHEMDEIVDSGCHFIVGNDIESIEAAIEAKHQDDESAECSCVERVEDFEMFSGSYNPYRRRSCAYPAKKAKRVTGWIIHERPFTTERDPELLKNLSARVGPIIVSGSVYSSLDGEEGCNAEGFTVRHRRHGRSQINYNPLAIERRPYMAERRWVLKRMKGEFPSDIIHTLVSKISPSRWPNNHPYKDSVIGPSLYSTGSWGSRSNNSFSGRDVLKYRDLSLKLHPRCYWWRDSGIENEWTFGGAVRKALEFVHGAEDKARAEYEKRLAAAAEEYKWKKKEEVWDKPPTKKKYLASHMESHGEDLAERLRFCRFLRAEARAMGIKMPRKPVMPLSPHAKRKLTKQRAKARAKARKRRKEKTNAVGTS